jgi:hypothetical protein
MENNYGDVPPPLTVEEIRNMDLTGVDPTPTKIYETEYLGKPGTANSEGQLETQPRTP